MGFENNIVAAVDYAIEFSLLFIAMTFFRNNNPGPVKYIYVYVYVVIQTISEIIYFYGKDTAYNSGNLVELFIVIFSPVFVNRRFTLTVTICLVVKYGIVSLVIQDPKGLLGMAIVLILASIAFILLIRFQDYVGALGQSFSTQRDTIVKGIVATLELKDPYTRGHSERVAYYSLLLAQKVGKFNEEELRGFYCACLLHDIGKIHIPDRILTKPTSLTDEEYEIIKKHPSVGAEAVKEIHGLQNCVDVILYHHERWDGQGYPSQLKGADIPILARIASVADAFDAMTTLRSYRSALSPEEAFQRIVNGGGTQFDPKLVMTFKEVFPAWMEFLNLIQWREIKELSPSV